MAEKKGRKKWTLAAVLIFNLLLLGAGAYAFYVYNSLTSAVDTMQEPIQREKSGKREETITLKEREPFSVLLLGVDERQGDKGRSDTMIVLTVNPDLKSVKMLSIPRDTRTGIIGHGTEDKINHAYAFGDVEMAINTVEDFLDIPIDYYIKMNMAGFKDIVDAVNGIDVTNETDFNMGKFHFNEGSIHLNGSEALSYVRMRKDDPNGDFGRQQRQRQVIQGVINKGASFSSLTRFDDIFAALGKNVKTDITFKEMMDIQKNYKDTRNNIQQLTIEGDGQYIGDIWYLIVPDEERQRVQGELKGHLGLPQ
ncbi:LytR family transcriptional regulator [Bacillus sp. NTK034]|uniref:polyisoprenyl-teichoic acid--peptidoglycan teichoic acid transferase TagU n=1 Tax=Bacillus sp. NTK034 TaxID=2802176 RepID=UPI001A90763A|nr:LytR family transcriptional regulator [Bacillus sp. NTK034]MBN8201839.1 LytR family transcriptional regulator [Bacillus sp. NTK034]